MHLRVCVCVCVCVDSAAGCGKSFTTRVSKLHFTLQMEFNSHKQICFFRLHTKLLNYQKKKKKNTFAQTINITQVSEINESFGSNWFTSLAAAVCLCVKIHLDLVFIETQTW